MRDGNLEAMANFKQREKVVIRDTFERQSLADCHTDLL
jgi:hypothetical protein